jgi:benzoylformate decarboxylase
MTVAELLVHTLAAQGVRYIFGNPGTTEIPLVKACERHRVPEYIVAPSEVSAVPMADGYARTTRSLGVVNLHVAPGLGNGMGGLYTAGIAQTPLLILVGGQDRRFLHTDPILWGPLEKMAGTVCKAVFGLNTTYDTAFNMRRALRSVLSPPFAPVALICPPDLLEQSVDVAPSSVIAPLLSGLSSDTARQYAERLSDASSPALIAAEDVHWNGGAESLERLANLLGCPVYCAPYTAVLPIASRSLNYAGYLPPSRKQIADRLSRHDVLFFVGGRGMRTTLYSEAELPQTKLWVGNNIDVLGADGEFEMASVADTGTALDSIIREIEGTTRARSAVTSPLRPPFDLPERDGDTLHPSRAVHALLEQFHDAIWIDESGLSTSDVRQWMQLSAGEYVINGSGGIGWGIAASVGAAIGNPTRQVVAIIGDGSALYASEALWTAAHHSTKLLLVILANRRYATLNEAASRLAGKTLESFTMEPPVMDFSGLATLYGWKHVAARSESDLTAFLQQHGTMEENTLLELKLDPSLKPVAASRHF